MGQMPDDTFLLPVHSGVCRLGHTECATIHTEYQTGIVNTSLCHHGHSCTYGCIVLLVGLFVIISELISSVLCLRNNTVISLK